MTTKNEGLIDVRKAADRFDTSIDWLKSKHSFSFGGHYDADNTNHGLFAREQ